MSRLRHRRLRHRRLRRPLLRPGKRHRRQCRWILPFLLRLCRQSRRVLLHPNPLSHCSPANAQLRCWVPARSRGRCRRRRRLPDPRRRRPLLLLQPARQRRCLSRLPRSVGLTAHRWLARWASRSGQHRDRVSIRVQSDQSSGRPCPVVSPVSRSGSAPISSI